MIEKIVLDYLSENISAPVCAEVPEAPSETFRKMPKEFVVIDKTAGSIEDKIRFAQIAIQSYSLVSLFDASELNEMVHEVMDNMAAYVDEVSECKMVADSNFTDTSTKRYRYQCLYNIYY